MCLRLEAWTSAIRADAHRSGALTVHRWDLLLGPSARCGRGASPLPAPASSASVTVCWCTLTTSCLPPTLALGADVQRAFWACALPDKAP